MNEKNFSTLKEALVGDSIITSGDDFGDFEDECSLEEKIKPLGIMRLGDVEQISRAVKWARKEKVPLVPVSSSPPHHRGDTALKKPSAVLDMRGFQKIIMVNRRNRVALFEAGVTFERLTKEIQSTGLRTMTPLLPRKGKSALSAYLEREPTIYPKYQWDISDPLLCIEVVWGTGDIFRTGSAAGPGTLDQQWRAGEFQKNPMGPGQNDWVRLVQGAQGSIGIATWCSAKAEIKPQIEELFIASSNKLEPLISTSYKMFHGKYTDIHFILDKNAFIKLLAVDEKSIADAQKKTHHWNLIYSVSGLVEFPEERISLFKKKCEHILKEKSVNLTEPPLGSREELLGLLQGVSPEPYWKKRPLGGMREVFFQTTLDKTPIFINFFKQCAEDKGIPAERIAVYIQPQLGGRLCHLEFILGYNPSDEKDTKTINDFADNIAGPLIEKGAFFSRPYGAWALPAMATAQDSIRIQRKIKAIFDPDGILSPGRLGLGGN